MAKLACPYCYHRIDGGRLWFQCTGRPSPGKTACPPGLDEARARETSYQQASPPSFPPKPNTVFVGRQAACPVCGSQTGIRVCPCCHTPLSSGFGDSKSPLIAMIGAKGTGKTIYLSVLAHELRNGLRRRFDADVRMVSKPASFDIDKIFRERALPAQTAQAVGGRSEPVLFEWRRERRLGGVIPGYQTTYLSFYDTAGEDLTQQNRAHDLTYLGAADALILLLDPFMIPGAHDRIKLPDSAMASVSNEPTVDVVHRVTEALRAAHGVGSHRKVKVPVAVAFAKIDAFFDVLGSDHPLVQPPMMTGGVYDETVGQITHENVRAVLYDWGGDDIDTHLRHHYTDFRYFAVSSLGVEPDYEAARDAKPISARGVQPYRVDEPLVWLLSRFSVVPRTEQR